ncbi:hypothetical protein [Pseudooctadecabacter jejudonensis]|uniref:Uncharacterized protein n=1 Tax=Pseudooctadecabacter jejudonensis TaxID=1391910 RepID=A0A1Y5T796_9RHOB|nr:hypothetical protein [Pseudooctadecabacter jejudonensis]SLN54138.1 hypothetical protein PSJ8397_02826 [Pseudooctadecabacter jejudonensis]
MKRWGFLTGAVLAAIGVWLFYALTEVTDKNRLARILADHCLPYVHTGTDPFADTGRAPGVYDTTPTASLTNGGIRILDDGRFTAVWGEASDEGVRLRLCTLEAAGPAGFSIAPASFVPSITAQLSTTKPLVPDTQALPEGTATLVWSTPDMPPNTAYRALAITTRSGAAATLQSLTLIDTIN